MPKAKRRSSGKVKKGPVRPCTYELGYVRQDLYACSQCTESADGVHSGFCRGCRETCHADHLDQVFELYTKRSFRCDCGNTRAQNTCLLLPNKDDLNVGNERSYSHNFESRYCRCDRDYDCNLPMAQCAMCEDWFHEDCYVTDRKARGGRDFSLEYELICKDCVATLPVLSEYYETLHAWSSTPPRVSSDRNACIRPKDANVARKPGSVDYIWSPSFRLHLCQCADCMSLYREAKALYIVDRSDFVSPVETDDAALLVPTDDTEVVRDVLDEEEADRRRVAREKAMLAKTRIPRKQTTQPVNKRDPVDDVTSRLAVDSVSAIRKRINTFLRESIESNGGQLNRDSVIAYMTDLKADLVASFTAKLHDAASES